jgi:acyl transferase domain-containing protein
VGNVFAKSRRSDAPEDRLLIGSIKPNLGHTEGASALASIMKTVLSLEAGEIPPTYGVENLNPHIDFEGAKVTVIKDGAVPWPKGKVRRASVNSFGFGGANGHCIIDHVNEVLPGYVKPGVIQHLNGHSNGASNGLSKGHANGHTNGHRNGSNGTSAVPHHSPITVVGKSASPSALTRKLVVLPFSAHNASSLKQNISALSKVIPGFNLADIAYTLGARRSRLQQRTFHIVNSDDVEAGLSTDQRVFTSPVQTASVGYVFTGQVHNGTQWAPSCSSTPCLETLSPFSTTSSASSQRAHPGRLLLRCWASMSQNISNPPECRRLHARLFKLPSWIFSPHGPFGLLPW